METEKDKAQALGLALSQIEKQFGKGSIMRMGENTHMDIEAIPTGALSGSTCLPATTTRPAGATPPSTRSRG